jgi:2-C-methyl-D-erythritol 2,4-cyclodiphosphate synthase
MRIGQGYDVHKLVRGRRLILGGIEVPYELGLLGHSDADVLIHAIMDALLGSAGAGDIGRHFPDNDQTYKDAVSIELLKKTISIVNASGFSIINIDTTIIAEKPKLAGYIPQMRQNIADVTGLVYSNVSIKATTTEGLGFTGRGEGIGAMAVVLLDDKTGEF